MENYLGADIPKLGFGLMRLPKNGNVINIEETKAMVDLFIASGFCYFDTSWGYPGSEDAIKAALVDRYPRGKYILATKCPVWTVKSRNEAEQMLYTSLNRTGVDYFDFYLLHNLGENRTRSFEDYDTWTFLLRKKEEGLIKHLGFSIHDKAAALDEILIAHPEAEFVQLQINYADWENPSVESRKCYETARRHGKSVIIMEPVKGGSLANPPPQIAKLFRAANPAASLASWAVRYAASLDGVITVLSGMSNMEQMKDNVSYMKEFKLLTKNEYAVIEKVRDIFNAIPIIPCTACAYCMKGCANSVAIYGIFQAMNILNVYDDITAAKQRYAWNTTGHGWGKASKCIGCGNCENVCPQHISIRDDLKKAADILET